MKGYSLQKPWLLGRMHVSWQIAWMSIGIVCGAAIAPSAGDAFVNSSWLAIVVVVSVIVFIKGLRWLALFALVAGGLIGLWRGSAEHIALQEYTPYYGKVVHVKGNVTEDVSFGPKGDQRLRLGKVSVEDRSMGGTLWISISGVHDIKRGDVAVLSGVLQEGFGNVPASMYRAQVEKIERPIPGDVGRRARDWFDVGVYRAMPPDDAALALAYLVGQKLNLPEELAKQLVIVGLIHAVVASGYQLTVLVTLARKLFIKVSKYLTALFSTGLITGFILITGFSPSMTRAGLVSGLSLAAWYYGRVVHPLVLLPFAAALTVLYKPEYVWGDIGWYLSFAAFTGVILLTPLLHHYFWGRQKRPSALREILVTTVAAQLLTMPITIHVFGYASVYAVLANILVVPLIPITMLLTFVAGVAGLLLPSLATWFGWPVSLLLQYMREVVGWIAHLPAARAEMHFGLPLVVASYIGIGLIIVYLWRVTGHNFRRDTDLQKDF